MGAKYQHYIIVPEQGWDSWSNNPNLSDLIYEIGFEKVISDKWHYINPMTGMGIFEDKMGQYLCLETQDIGKQNHILSMHYGLRLDHSSDFHDFIERLKDDHDLLTSPMTDNGKRGKS